MGTEEMTVREYVIAVIRKQRGDELPAEAIVHDLSDEQVASIAEAARRGDIATAFTLLNFCTINEPPEEAGGPEEESAVEEAGDTEAGEE